MKPFDAEKFIRAVLQACASRDWQTLSQLDDVLSSALQQSVCLSGQEVSRLQAVYQQMLQEIGYAMQHSSQELTQYLQQREQRMAYAEMAMPEDDV